MQKIIIHEVGLRDGLQMEKQVVPTEQKIKWISELMDSGVDIIQIGSFVHPEKIPQMADTDNLFAELTKNKTRKTILSGLVLNEKGLERGEKCGVEMFCMGVSASETHSKKNTGMSIAEATDRIIAMGKQAIAVGKRVQVSVQSAFGCGFEGPISSDRVLDIDKSQIQERIKKLLEKAEKPKEFTKGLQELLKSYVDREATKNYQRIIPDTGKFYGVPLPILKVVAAEIGKFIQKKPTKAQVLLETIWNEGSFEAKQIAGKSLEKFGPKNPKVCLDFVSSILLDLDNWANCDNLAMCGVEPIVYQNPELVFPLSEKWIKDKNKWIRRFGVVTLLGYKKVKTTDKVFSLLDLVMKDQDKDVKKAVSWMLREITKKNPNEVAKFLMKWAKANPNKDTRWVIKDGMKKLGNNEQKRILELLN